MKLIFYIILPIIIFSSCTKRVIEYFQSDEKKIKNIYNFKNGKKDGIQQEYYFNGKIYMEETYVNGLRDGICKLYYGLSQK
jgi:antitoxin component YwqK of YwqJK toxin-antitoxin module